MHTARWVYCDDAKKLEEFRTKAYDNLALDHSGALVYLAPSRVNLELTLERWPNIAFRETREHLAGAPDVEGGHSPRSPGVRLGALRLGELRVRDDRDGRRSSRCSSSSTWTPGVAPTVSTYPARQCERHCEPDPGADGAVARRDRRPGSAHIRMLAIFTAIGVGPPRCWPSCIPPCVQWPDAVRARVDRFLGRHRLQRLAAAPRRAAGPHRFGVGLRLCAGLSGRRPAVRRSTC